MAPTYVVGSRGRCPTAIVARTFLEVGPIDKQAMRADAFAKRAAISDAEARTFADKLARLGPDLARAQDARVVSAFASIGNAIAAGLMGGVGYLVSASATFFLGALLAIPGLFALRAIERPRTPLADAASMADPSDEEPQSPGLDGAASDSAGSHSILVLLRDRRLAAFAVCAALFFLSNAAMLPLAAGEITKAAEQQAELIIAACILGPQLMLAAISPHVGRLAEPIGRRPVMLVGFAALPIRGLLLATSGNPWLIMLFQLLDGVSAAAFQVMLPLITADLTRGTGRFNLCMGFFGLAVGIGASFSTTLAGFVADRSVSLSFLMLAVAGAACVLMVWLLFGDTTPRRKRQARG